MSASAARHTAAVFTAHLEKSNGDRVLQGAQGSCRGGGATCDQSLPGLSPMIAATAAEARRMAHEPHASEGADTAPALRPQAPACLRSTNACLIVGAPSSAAVPLTVDASGVANGAVAATPTVVLSLNHGWDPAVRTRSSPLGLPRCSNIASPLRRPQSGEPFTVELCYAVCRAA